MFGFSPGDIVLFSKFAAKVIQALRDEGGSRSEFQLAARQCEAFLSALNELKSLDLSSLPESFRFKITQSSSSLKGFIDDFRKSVASYEKSLAEESQRGAMSSAPRKVQWAFVAAEDLGKFRQCLSVELDNLKLMIQISVLSVMTGTAHPPRTLGAGPTSSELVLSSQPAQGGHRYIDWNRSGLAETLMLQRAETITDLVYERLLTRGGISVEMQGRVHTLPEQVTTGHGEANLQEVAQPQPLPPTTIRASTSTSNTQPTLDYPAVVQPGYEDASSAVGGINEYLRSLNLAELSEEERWYVESADPSSRLLLPETEAPDDHPSETRAYKPKDKASSRSQPCEANRTFKKSSLGPDGLEGLGLAVSILGIVSIAAQLSSRASRIYRSPTNTRNVVDRLSRLLFQYSTLLHAAFEVIRSSIPVGELQELGWQIVKDSQKTARDIEGFLRKVENPGGVVRTIGSMAMWVMWKDEIKGLMQELETLKTTLSAMLQIHQVEVMHMGISSGRGLRGQVRPALPSGPPSSLSTLRRSQDSHRVPHSIS